MSEREQVLLETGFVLHHRAVRNSSQLLECLTENHGRVGLVARGTRGARRAASPQRAFLQPFVPLKLSWLRRGELGRLTHVETTGAAYALGAERLYAAYYSNELLLRLLARGDPNAEVFSCYSRCLIELGGGANVARSLRFFELELLRALGYGIELESDVSTGEPLAAERLYRFEPELGVVAAGAPRGDEPTYEGRVLISLRERNLNDDDSLRAAQQLLGTVLKSHLGDRPLKSRAVLRDIVARGL
jgi:DNA repair protein RecO (recombination protein O)